MTSACSFPVGVPDDAEAKPCRVIERKERKAAAKPVALWIHARLEIKQHGIASRIPPVFLVLSLFFKYIH